LKTTIITATKTTITTIIAKVKLIETNSNLFNNKNSKTIENNNNSNKKPLNVFTTTATKLKIIENNPYKTLSRTTMKKKSMK
jgi:hypothetical protein